VLVKGEVLGTVGAQVERKLLLSRYMKRCLPPVGSVTSAKRLVPPPSRLPNLKPVFPYGVARLVIQPRFAPESYLKLEAMPTASTELVR
jgi:hypothetical protein